MKFSRKYTNKLVSFVDRYYTYDGRSMKREGDKTYFDFWAYNNDNGSSVAVPRNPQGMFVSIRKDNKVVFRAILTTYTEIDNFKRMIKCLG